MDKILREYQQAHKKVHGETPKMVQNGRWVYINGDFVNSHCKSKIPAMTQSLKQKIDT